MHRRVLPSLLIAAASAGPALGHATGDPVHEIAHASPLLLPLLMIAAVGLAAIGFWRKS